jgi:NTP pyrophosphatase (non-canonical NTP hydrolase)
LATVPFAARDAGAMPARPFSTSDTDQIMADFSLPDFQKHIADRYLEVDRARGSAKTFVWFIEEVGELATALNGDDRNNLEEEFADVLAWLCTLANIEGVDLAAALEKKYLSDKSPQGHK